MMSPPCQPHTRQGNRKDEEDTRSQPLAHIGTVSYPLRLDFSRYLILLSKVF
jgi:hypothetical protein